MGVMTRFLLLLWVGVTASTAVDLQKRVIGGRDCKEHERLYHVEVRQYRAFPGEDFLICGGSLISNRWILTAEHCWNPTRIMKAVLGIHPGGQGTPVDVTPKFFSDSLKRLHDIMLLELTNLTLILPVPLPNCGPPNPLKIGDTVEMAGRAAMITGANNKRVPGRAPVLQCVNIKVVDCQDLIKCLQTNYQTSYEGIKYQHWKCFQRSGVDISHGDSGGGVVFNDRIYGVQVFTGNPDYACVEAAGFMDVCEYMDWIVTTTGIPRP